MPINKLENFFNGQSSAVVFQRLCPDLLERSSEHDFNCSLSNTTLYRWPRRSSSTESIKAAAKENQCLLDITRVPIKCPIGDCDGIMGLSLVLTHYLRDHHDEHGIHIRDTYEDEEAYMIFAPSDLEYDMNICMGALAYGGRNKDSYSRPAKRHISVCNSFLPKPYEELDDHLPILIMGRRTRWSTVFGHEVQDQASVKPAERKPSKASEIDEIMVVWLASAQTTKPIYCNVCLFNREMSASMSSILKLRNLSESQNPMDFMESEVDFMCLCQGQINILSENRTNYICLLVTIHEYDCSTPCTEHPLKEHGQKSLEIL